MNRLDIKAWIQASRPAFFIATLIPLTIGWILAAREGMLRPGRFLWVTSGALIIHLATNLSNDYFDHIQGTDSGAAIGGSRVIQEGKISASRLRRILIVLYAMATIMGMVLILSLDLWGIFPVALFALFSSVFYVAPPVRYGYHGLGELFVAVNMGPVLVCGTYWVIAGKPAWLPLHVSIPVGFMVASILYYQSLPDMKTDEAVGKRTLAVMLGRRGAFLGLIIIWICIYSSIAALVFAGILSNLALLGFVTLPLFFLVLYHVKKTRNWVDLDRYGKYVRMLYFLNGLCIILSILF